MSDKRAFELCDHRDGCCYLFDNYFWFNGRLPLVAESKSLWTFSVYDKELNRVDEFYNYDILKNAEYVKNNRAPLMGWVNHCTEGYANVDFYNDEMKVLYYGNDTVFKVEKESMNMKPLFVLSIGEKPSFQISHALIKSDKFFNYSWINDFFESEKYWYFILSKSDMSYIVRFEKENGSIILKQFPSIIKETKFPSGMNYKRRDNMLFTFVNDIAGIEKFVVTHRYGGKYLVDVIHPSNEDDLKNVRGYFLKTGNQKMDITEDDNPILVIATLK